MLKKKSFKVFLAVLSFFVLIMAFSCCTNAPIDNTVKAPRLKMYLSNKKAEPKRITSKAKVYANSLYDGLLEDTSCEDDAEVTFDMGNNILCLKVRYYVSDIENNNCLGTRFYASKNGSDYVEIGCVNEKNPPENEWYEIAFDGLLEYRYFRAQIPEKSNITELEWIEAAGFSVMPRNKKYDVTLSLCGFDAIEDIDATVVLAVFDEFKMLKAVSLSEQKFLKDTPLFFDIKIKDVQKADTYKVFVIDKDGKLLLEKPLSYTLNNASHSFSVASVFSDNMVIQAEKPTVIWGRGKIDTEVEVCIENTLGGRISKKTKVDENSRWEIDLGLFSQGGDYVLSAKADEREYRFKNITFGDVWLLTGQSNMDRYLKDGSETEKELENPDIDNENIRIFNLWGIGMDGAALPIDNTQGGAWYKMDKESSAYLSSVGYYFSREIQEKTAGKVGVINVAVGDTEINRWIKKGKKHGAFLSTDGDLYNNRIHPLSKLNIKGIILYQGEADQYRTHLSVEEYSDAMAGLVDDYREIWGEKLPFYWAQLTRYKVDESLVREGQRVALSKVKNKENTGMICLIDIFGNYDKEIGSARYDIHPWGKKIVAERFARFAKRDCYGEDIKPKGPEYQSFEIKGDSIELKFDCTGSLKVMPKEQYADKETIKYIKENNIDENSPCEFEIAGEDKKYYKAEAILEGNKVILKSDMVKKPMYARYAWGAYPEMPNLTDDTNLPTPTFCTENLS